MQDEFSEGMPPLDELIRDGLGQLTRVFGTRPVATRPKAWRELTGCRHGSDRGSRFGIPAIAHEECLTGFAAWCATMFPTPLAWGASFDPELVRDMAAAIGRSMRAAGVHQGLAPVLDVARDPRWGRVEETIGEDPYLVGTIGTAYVPGLQSTGVHATLKHFAGYSASRAGRNMAPVSIGPREFTDVLLPPFEMAIRLGGARSVMPTYIATDGVPATADPVLLGAMLRDKLGFDGLVVSDYYAVSFLELQHAVAGSPEGAAALALTAGVDVELPSVRCYGAPLQAAAAAGDVTTAIVDQAVGPGAAAEVRARPARPGRTAVPGWDRRRAALARRPRPARAPRDGPPPRRGIDRAARQRRAAAAVATTGRRPWSARSPTTRWRSSAATRCPGTWRATPTARVCRSRRCCRAARATARRDVTRAAATCAATTGQGSPRQSPRAVRLTLSSRWSATRQGCSDAATSGEGCDVTDLRLPGVQEDLLHALAETGTPVVAVLVTGRPYAIGGVADRLAAVVQGFFPGEEGGRAIADVLTGRVVPSGKLPVEMPGSAGAQPSTYLRSRNAARHSGSSVDPTPLFAFGHGLSYTTFGYSDLVLSSDKVPTDGTVEISCIVRNTGTRAGTEVVQLYLSDAESQVVRPVHWLAGFTRVRLEPGQARRVAFRVHADRTAFTGLSGERIVEPGEIGVAVGGSSDNLPLAGSFVLTGPVRVVDSGRVLDTPVSVHDLPGSGCPASTRTRPDITIQSDHPGCGFNDSATSGYALGHRDTRELPYGTDRPRSRRQGLPGRREGPRRPEP